jgi:hypothetical protein
MNTYLQLIRDSIFAPRAAVDLARNHPNPYQLGWIFVGITAVWAVICDATMRNFVRPLITAGQELAAVKLAWYDTTFGSGALGVLSYVLTFILLRGFWRRMSDHGVSQQSVDAAIVVAYACAVALLFPQYALMALTENAGILPILIGWSLPIVIGMALYTVYFSYALNMSKVRSFWLNVLSVAMLITVSLVLVVVGFVIYVVLFGIPQDFVGSS